MRKNIYLALSERLNQLIVKDDKILLVSKEQLQEMTNNGEVINRTIKRFDLWNDNVDFLGEEQPSEFPLCFFEFLPIKWQQLSNGSQMGKVAVLLHIVDQYLYPTHSESEFKDKGLEFLDLLDMINLALSGFSSENIGSISHTESHTNHNHADVIESLEKFEMEVRDDTCVKKYTKFPVKPYLEKV